MRKIILLVVLIIVGLTLFSFSNLDKNTAEVPYPEGYREWKHIKSAIIGPKSPAFQHFGGFHHIYANSKAVEGYKTNHFEDGSVLVFDVLEAIEKETDFSEGKRRILDVMIKDSKLYAETSGWGFEEFREDSKIDRLVRTMATQQCFECHLKRKSTDFVFSQVRE